MTLTKNDLIEAIHSKIGPSKNRSNDIVEATIGIIKDTLVSGEDVLISGFGKFQVKAKDARRGRNPATGEDLRLESRRVVTFKVSGKMRKAVNRYEKTEH